MKKLNQILNKDQLFATERLAITNWSSLESQAEPRDLLSSVSQIMSPEVTRALPHGWQNLNTPEQVENWIKERKTDSFFYAVSLEATQQLIGFLFLYPEHSMKEKYDLRIGYLLAASTWGKGLGSELLSGLVHWGKNTGKINSLSGGVEKDNIASIKVLEKNGFQKAVDNDMPEGTLLYSIDFED